MFVSTVSHTSLHDESDYTWLQYVQTSRCTQQIRCQRAINEWKQSVPFDNTEILTASASASTSASISTSTSSMQPFLSPQASQVRYSLSDLLHMGDAKSMQRWKTFLRVVVGSGSDGDSGSRTMSMGDYSRDILLLGKECTTSAQVLNCIDFAYSVVTATLDRVIEIILANWNTMTCSKVAGDVDVDRIALYNEISCISASILLGLWGVKLCAHDPTRLREQLVMTLSYIAASAKLTLLSQEFVDILISAFDNCWESINSLHLNQSFFSNHVDLMSELPILPDNCSRGYPSTMTFRFLRVIAGEDRMVVVSEALISCLGLGSTHNQDDSSQILQHPATMNNVVIPAEDHPRLLLLVAWLLNNSSSLPSLQYNDLSFEALATLDRDGPSTTSTSIKGCESMASALFKCLLKAIRAERIAFSIRQENNHDKGASISNLIEELMQV